MADRYPLELIACLLETILTVSLRLHRGLVLLPLMILLWRAGSPAAMGSSPSPVFQQACSGATRNTLRVDPQKLFQQGEKALQEGDLAGAESAFRQVLAIDPRTGGAYANLGVVKMRRKEWDQAISLLRKAEEL